MSVKELEEGGSRGEIGLQKYQGSNASSNRGARDAQQGIGGRAI